MNVTDKENREEKEIFEYEEAVEEEKTVPVKKEVFEWLDVVISAIVVVVITFTFVFRVSRIVAMSFCGPRS